MEEAIDPADSVALEEADSVGSEEVWVAVEEPVAVINLREY